MCIHCVEAFHFHIPSPLLSFFVFLLSLQCQRFAVCTLWALQRANA